MIQLEQKTIIEGTQQQADVKDQNLNYHNKNVPDAVKKGLDDINTKEGTSKVVEGSGELIDWTTQRSIDAVSAVAPVDEGVFYLTKDLGFIVKHSSFSEVLAVKTAERIISETPKGKLPRTVTVIVDSKTGKVYEGVSGGIKSMDEVAPEVKKLLPKKSKEKWSVFNCAECDALNKAIKDGAKQSDLEMHTVQIEKKTKNIESRERCRNCKISTKKIKTTSD